MNNAGLSSGMYYALKDENLNFPFHLAFLPSMTLHIKCPIMVGILKRAIHYPVFHIYAITFCGGSEKDLFPLSFCGSDWPYSLQPTYMYNQPISHPAALQYLLRHGPSPKYDGSTFLYNVSV